MHVITHPGDGMQPILTAIRSARTLVEIAIFRCDLVSGLTSIRAQYILDLRTAPAAVYMNASLPPPTYPDSGLVPGVTPIKSVHIQDCATQSWRSNECSRDRLPDGPQLTSYSRNSVPVAR